MIRTAAHDPHATFLHWKVSPTHDRTLTLRAQEIQYSSGKTRLTLSILIGVICWTNLHWIHTNVAPPRMYDDAVYLTDSVSLLRTIQERGVVPFLLESAQATKGHPPMIKILPVPFFLVFGAATASALYAYTVLIAVFCVYLFFLVRELFQNEETALLSVAMTVAFPLTFGMWRNVMSEFGTAVAVTACLYHFVRSDGLRVRKHALLAAVFFGWGMLWKITFPIFVAGPMACVVIGRLRSRRGNIIAFGAVVLAVAGPFYWIGGRDVIEFALMASNSSQSTEMWSLGPVLSPKTVILYWLSIVNFGISPYWFGVLGLLLVVNLRRAAEIFARNKDAWLFLSAWFVLPLLFLSFQVLKEIRHLLPALPVIGIAGAALLVNTLRRTTRIQRLAWFALVFTVPAYQFVALSFDTRYAPRRDLRLGPFILSVKDLELASLQLIPTYTFPANPTAWPTWEVVSAIASHASYTDGRLPSVRVVGEHPYLSGLVLIYQSALSRTPVTSHGPFSSSDPAFSDFSVVVCGPEGKYGPLDRREPQVAAALADPRNGFQEVARVSLPTQCDALIYKNERLARR